MAFNLERPDLKPLAKNLIDMVEQAMVSDSGVPMLKLVEMFGIELDDDERRRLRGRGDIRINSRGDALNEGAEEVFSGAVINIHLPRTLKGTVTRERGGFVLSFADDKNGIVARKGFVKAMVRALKVYPEKADLEMSNSLFTLHFTW